LKIAIVIPARYQSSRLPGKPLLDLGGKSLIQRVYEKIATTEIADRLIVATDDERIQAHVQSFEGVVQMTDSSHESGTDRVAQVARGLPDCDLVINVQGDEPFVSTEDLKLLISCFEDPATEIATLQRPIDEESDLFSPNVVKVTCGTQGQALYFSRQAIPFLRDLPLGRWLEAKAHFQHIGLYAFRRNTLLSLTELPPANLEQHERLEQLRWLSAGYRIKVATTHKRSIGIDTPADLERARRLFNS
jgi:3-deoxy-manno-octulosonate cytidylyltransferase (CMP-KDO synthetase)